MEKEHILIAAYDKQYIVMQHYSSFLYKGRISVITLSTLVWAYILGVFTPKSATPLFLSNFSISATDGMAIIAMLLIPVFAMIENAYFKRFFDAISAGKSLEKELSISSYFTRYKQGANHPFFIFYWVSVIAFGLYPLAQKRALSSFMSLVVTSISCVLLWLLQKQFVLFARSLETNPIGENT